MSLSLSKVPYKALLLSYLASCHGDQNILTNDGIDRTDRQVLTDPDQPGINTAKIGLHWWQRKLKLVNDA